MWSWSTGSREASSFASDNSPAACRDAGFTLLEVLVALAVTAALLGALLPLFSIGVYSARRAEAYSQATLWAESKLETIDVSEPLQEGVTAGAFGDGFRWQTVVRQYPAGEGSGGVARVVSAYEVQVTVFWREGRREREVTLQTMRLARRR